MQQTTMKSSVDELSEYGRKIYLGLESSLSPSDSGLLLAKLACLNNQHLGNLEKAAIDAAAEKFYVKIKNNQEDLYDFPFTD